jgi:hypothetical protein
VQIIPNIQNRIYEIRGERVRLDSGLAASMKQKRLYVSTRPKKTVVKRKVNFINRNIVYKIDILD